MPRRELFLNVPGYDVLPPLIVGKITDRDWQAWLEPRSGDLLHDAEHFYKKAREVGTAESGRYSRAATVFSVAAIEAISNDALVSIYELMIDAWPSECIGLNPWRAFRGRSEQRVARLLDHGNLPRKIRYLLDAVQRLSYSLADIERLQNNLVEAERTRNRIMHMVYLWRPNHARAVLTPGQALHLAKKATETAREYIETLAETFDEIHLPIRTIRHYKNEPI
jgi:hypothetical protein